MSDAASSQLIDRYIAAYFCVSRAFLAEIRDAVQEELTPDQFLTLRYIKSREKCTATELADVFLVGKSSITAIITRLSERGFIRRIRDRSDRRLVYLTLSERGREVFAQAEEKVREIVSAYLVHFEPLEVETFIGTMEKLASLMGGTNNDDAGNH